MTNQRKGPAGARQGGLPAVAGTDDYMHDLNARIYPGLVTHQRPARRLKCTATVKGVGGDEGYRPV